MYIIAYYPICWIRKLLTLPTTTSTTTLISHWPKQRWAFHVPVVMEDTWDVKVTLESSLLHPYKLSSIIFLFFRIWHMFIQIYNCHPKHRMETFWLGDTSHKEEKYKFTFIMKAKIHYLLSSIPNVFGKTMIRIIQRT